MSSYRPRERIPEKPSQEDIYSQDMFEDSESTHKEKENLIKKMQMIQKKKKESVSPKPMRITKAGNPFKKVQEDAKNVSLNDSTSEPKLTFMEWYEENRQRLQDENPLLKESELAVMAMKQYRQRSQLNTSIPLDEVSSESNKIQPEIKKKKNLFGKSDSAVKKLNTSVEVEDEKKDELPEAETRKRKADSVETNDEDKPKKKSNSFSKLKAFSFTKPT